MDKIKTDLKGFQIGENISLWCIVDNAVHIYHMTIADMTGIGNETPNPPYNSAFVKVVVNLNESKVTGFVQDMVKTNAIFVLPFDTPGDVATPTPAPITSSHTYALPLNKLQLSGECLTSGTNFLVLLVTADQQHYSYPVSLAITPGNTCLSKQSAGTNPSVTVTLNNITLDVANTFTTELAKATAIYLIQQ